MKVRFCVAMLFLLGLLPACQSETQSMPKHAQEVIKKHRLKDSLRTLELIESLKQDSSQMDSIVRPKD